MKLFVKNMVCSRCKLVVKDQFQKAGLKTSSIELGEIEIDREPTVAQLEKLDSLLRGFGFELIDSKRSRIIEKIKNLLINLVHTPQERRALNLSGFLSDKLRYEYTYLSSLFSEIEGITIEKYFISLRIERVKELLLYGELTLSEIADQLGYSSSAYLSNQFKQVTGLTPSFYKSLKEHKRRNIEDL